jgi:hypothetical protein
MLGINSIVIYNKFYNPSNWLNILITLNILKLSKKRLKLSN